MTKSRFSVPFGDDEGAYTDEFRKELLLAKKELKRNHGLRVKKIKQALNLNLAKQKLLQKKLLQKKMLGETQFQKPLQQNKPRHNDKRFFSILFRY